MKKYKIELSFLFIILSIVLLGMLPTNDYSIPSTLMLVVSGVDNNTVMLEDTEGNIFWADKPRFECKAGDPVGVSVDLKYKGKTLFEPSNKMVIEFPWKYDDVVWNGLGVGYTPAFMALVIVSGDDNNVVLRDNDGNLFTVKSPEFKCYIGMDVVVVVQLQYTAADGWAGIIDAGTIEFKL